MSDRIININQNSIYVIKEELKKVIPLHKHPQSHILVVLDGVAQIDIEENTYYIPNGFFVWIPSNISHRVFFESEKITILSIYYPNSNTLKDNTIKNSIIQNNSLFFSQVGVYATPSLLYHTFEQIQDTHLEQIEENWKIELLTTMRNILPHITKSKITVRLPQSKHPIIQRIQKIIHKKYPKELTATMVADEIGMSTRTMDRYFAKELHTSFYQYLKMYRVVESIKLLVKGDQDIANIAFQIGYDSPAAFSNAFFKTTGYRPSHLLKDLKD